MFERNRFPLQGVFFDLMKKCRVAPEMDGPKDCIQTVEKRVTVASGTDAVLFLFDARIRCPDCYLGDFCRCAIRSLTCYFEVVTGSALTPGIIAARPAVVFHYDQEGIFIAPRKKENPT
jgi:hypothetical protein